MSRIRKARTTLLVSILFLLFSFLLVCLGCGGGPTSTSSAGTVASDGGGSGSGGSGSGGGGSGGGGSGGGGGGGNNGTTTGDFYVATDGNDSWSGKFADPQGNPATDGPFATVNQARVAVQSMAKTRGTPIVVVVRGGSYEQSGLTFTAADSGSSSTAVVYENYTGETPVLTGAMQVKGWSNAGGNRWTATLPAGTVNFEALYYNGVRRMRPRLGAGTMGTYYRVAAQVNSCGGPCYDRFVYEAGDPISAGWQNLSPGAGNPCQAQAGVYPGGDIEVLIFEKWDVSRQRISCIDPGSHTIYLTGNTLSNGDHGYMVNHRYVVENVKDQLTQAGQWFLDRSTTPWALTYLANAGEDPTQDTVMVPQVQPVVNASGLQWVTFRGLTFSGDNVVTDDGGYAGDQAERSVPSAVNCNNCSNVTFDSDTFANLTGYGLGLVTDNKGTATGDVVENSAFYDLGAGGMVLGKNVNSGQATSSELQQTTVENNIIQGYGRMYAGAAGILPMVSHDVTITHNEISDGYNQGINVCIPSSTQPCGSFNMEVSYNHIWTLGQGILNDFGGIYLATYTATGNRVWNNKIHDIADASGLDGDGYGGHGIYLDQTTGLVDVENNLVYRATSTLYNMTMGPQVNGEANTFKNNIAAYGRQDVVGVSKCPVTTPLLQFNFTNNVVYQDRSVHSNPGATIQKGGARYFGTGLPTLVQNWANNLYFNSSEDFATDQNAFFSNTSSDCQGGQTAYSLGEWQAFGEDVGSVVKDPGFQHAGCSQTTAAACAADATQDDYSLPGGSPGVGFVPFETGPTCSTCAGRTSPDLLPPTVPATFTLQPFNPATDF